jgi:hypothetical protein
VNKPVLLSVVAVFTTGIGAALLWRTAGTDQVRVAEQHDSAIAASPTPATPAVQDGRTLPGQSDSTPGGGTELRPQRANEMFIRVLFPRVYDPDSLAKYRKTLEQEYEKKGKALALTPEEVNRIIDTLVRLRQESDAALRELGGKIAAGLALADSATEMQRLRQLENQREDIEMMALLGSKYTQWQESNLAPITLASVDNLQTLLEMSDVRPLTSEQAATLASALNAEHVRILRDTNADQKISPGADYPTGVRQAIEWEQRHTPDSNRSLEVIASRLLDPQQLAIYRRMLEDAYNQRLEALKGSTPEELDRRLRYLP